MKRPWRDGTEAVVFEPQDFIAKLAALTPAPRWQRFIHPWRNILGYL